MITLNNVTKSYILNSGENITAIKDINVSFKEGEVIVLKGASGSGKSTILSLIAALSKPTSGEVIVDGKKISKLSDDFATLYRRENIGFIFQKYNLIANLSVADNIISPLVPMNLDEKEVQKKLVTAMDMFHISHKKALHVKSLSGGEQQRVAIARANVNNPKIIIADEPTANLDKDLSFEFIKILKQLKKSNKTIIVATHDPLFFDLDFVDKIITISNGKII
jgi:putative ABC transport system ATP-binding protein